MFNEDGKIVLGLLEILDATLIFPSGYQLYDVAFTEAKVIVKDVFDWLDSQLLVVIATHLLLKGCANMLWNHYRLSSISLSVFGSVLFCATG